MVAPDLVVGADGVQKIRLGVFYESRCPDSKRFFVQQLAPAMRELGSILKPELVAFGHARVLGPNKMVCQHGPKECEGNRLMACVQSRATSELAMVETLVCLFEGASKTDDCISKHLPGVSPDDINKCKTSDESFQMMVKNEKLTGKLGYVPHITVDGQTSEEIQTGAEWNLKQFLCNYYKGPKPDSCKQQASV